MKDTIDQELTAGAPTYPAPPPVQTARLKRRHFAVFFSFWCLVVAPVMLAGWYLYEIAADQYASRVGFAVRSQDIGVPVDVLDGLGSIAGASSSDSDILYEFIRSQEMVMRVDARLDLRTRFSGPVQDRVFAFEFASPVEELVRFWQQMVTVHYDPGTGLIELEVKAFSSNDAYEIAQEILHQSSIMINQLSAIARKDRTRYAQEGLESAVVRLKTARRNLTAFRSSTQIVDPSADVQGQMTVLVSLQQQLAETYVELDLLSQTSRSDDPRLVNLQREVDVIEKRIDIERKKFGLSGNEDEAFSQVLGRFEELNVDLEFAQSSYLTALTAFEAAVREAQQQSRYLATFLNPTRPESAEYPQRLILLGLVAFFSFLIWSVLSLIYYSLRDRR